MLTPSSPIIFLNPNVLAPVFHIGAVSSTQAAVGLVGGAMRDEPIEALAWLASRIGAAIVGTGDPLSGTDARDMLLSRGLRAPWAPDWFAHKTLIERFAGISSWLDRHGARTSIIIDGPPPRNAMAPRAAAGSIVMTVTDGAQITMAACTRVAGIIADRAAPSPAAR